MAPKRPAAEGAARPTEERVDDEPEDLHAKISELQMQLLSLTESVRASTPASQLDTVAGPARLPPIQLIQKLVGKQNYRQWSTEIEAIAQSLDIWNIIINDRSHLALVQRQQYTKSLLILNISPDLQSEVSHLSTAHEIWEYLKRQFDTNRFSDLMQAARRLRTIKWGANYTGLEEFHRRFKDAKVVIKEVTSEPIPDLILTCFLPIAIEDRFEDFTTLIESYLAQPSTPDTQKTFEYTFERFRTAQYRGELREEAADYVAAMSQGERKKGKGSQEGEQREKCSYCDKVHRKICWTKNPELAPAYLQDYYKWKYQELMSKSKVEVQ